MFMRREWRDEKAPIHISISCRININNTHKNDIIRQRSEIIGVRADTLSAASAKIANNEWVAVYSCVARRAAAIGVFAFHRGERESIKKDQCNRCAAGAFFSQSSAARGAEPLIQTRVSRLNFNQRAAAAKHTNSRALQK